MLTPRTTLARRVTSVLDASPSRIPVLLGGCGSGRTTLLRQLLSRKARDGQQDQVVTFVNQWEDCGTKANAAGKIHRRKTPHVCSPIHEHLRR